MICYVDTLIVYCQYDTLIMYCQYDTLMCTVGHKCSECSMDMIGLRLMVTLGLNGAGQILDTVHCGPKPTHELLCKLTIKLYHVKGSNYTT